MVGKVSISLVAGDIKYQIDLNRRITIIRGNSGTGKSALHSLIYLSSMSDFVKIKCKYGVKAIRELYAYEPSLKELEGNIVFIDENSPLLLDTHFQELMLKYKIWFVIITRGDRYLQIPFSHKEVYEIITEDDCKINKRYYEDSIINKHYNSVIVDKDDPTYGILRQAGIHYDLSYGNVDMTELVTLEDFQNKLYLFRTSTFGRPYSKLRPFAMAGLIDVKSIECFEELVLEELSSQDTIIKDFVDNTSSHANRMYNTWEEFYNKALDTYLITKFGIIYPEGSDCICHLKPNCNNPYGMKLNCILNKKVKDIITKQGLAYLLKTKEENKDSKLKELSVV